MTPTEPVIEEAIAALEWLSGFIEGTSNAISTKDGFFADVFVDEFKQERAPKAFIRIDETIASLRALASAPAECNDDDDDDELLTVIARSIGRTTGVENYQQRARDVLDSIRSNNLSVPQPSKIAPADQSAAGWDGVIAETSFNVGLATGAKIISDAAERADAAHKYSTQGDALRSLVDEILSHEKPRALASAPSETVGRGEGLTSAELREALKEARSLFDGWWPQDYVDESMPYGRLSPDAWIVDHEGAPMLAPWDDGETPETKLADGDIVKFMSCVTHANIGLTLIAQDGYKFDAEPPAEFEQCCILNGLQAETVTSNIPDMIEALRACVDDTGETEFLASFYTFDDGAPYRFVAAERRFEKVTAQ